MHSFIFINTAENRIFKAEPSHCEVQLRQDDLPQVLRAPAAARQKLPEEEVRAHESAATEEEAQVSAQREPVLSSKLVRSIYIP